VTGLSAVVEALTAGRSEENNQSHHERSSHMSIGSVAITLIDLRSSSLSTVAVAEAVGYQSEAAFQRAFKSHMGVTPAQWRKTQESSGRDVFARPAVAAGAMLAKATEADTTDRRRPARGGDAPSLAER
jgi:AraC-like DNA-binding protein